MGTAELLATCWTTAGDAAPLRGDERSPVPLRERIEAAAAAGFHGFGLLHADLVVARDQYGFTGMRSMLDDNGIEHVELEFLTEWWTQDDRRTVSDDVRRDLLVAAEALGARHIKVAPDITAAPWDRDHWTSEFAALAAQASDAGTKVAIEFIPCANIANLHDGLRLVQDADHEAGGLMIDIWHVERAGTPVAEVADVPVRHIVGVELDDADAQQVGSTFEDTIDRRRLPGKGAFDVPGFIDALRAAGWQGPWGVEMLASDYRVLPVREATAAAYQASIEQFSIADGRS